MATEMPVELADVAIMRNNSEDLISAETIYLRPIADQDMRFLYQLYVSTRLSELASTGWREDQVEAFLQMQFRLQHTQYMQNYPGGSFDIIVFDNISSGRLYVNRVENKIHIIDITLLPEFRKRGIGGWIMKELAAEADSKSLIMSLYVEINNPILPFYKALGLKEIELRGIYYYMERGVMKTIT